MDRRGSRSRHSSKIFKELIGELELHKLLDEFDIQKVRNSFLKEETGEMNIDQLQKLLTEITRTIFVQKYFQLVFLRMNSRG